MLIGWLAGLACCHKKHEGRYYSVNRNSYLGVWDPGSVTARSPINQSQYVDIVVQQLTEV